MRLAVPQWWTVPRIALLIWAVVALAMLIAKAGAIAQLETVDPDDALRLVQIRDLLAGQPWWDVSQHRINPAGGGGMMHWSRIVDAPLAAGMLLLTPITGAQLAERIVAAIWPLALLAAMFMVLARTATRLGDRRFAMVTLLLLAADYMILFQFAPIRVDHHGWQILLSMVLLSLALRPAGSRVGVLAGLVAAVHVGISLEGLPGAALFGAIFALDWAWNGTPAAKARMIAYIGSMTLSAVAVQVATRGPAALTATWCDALSLPYLAALVAATLLVAGGATLTDRLRSSPISRLVVLAVAGAVAMAMLVLVEPACAAGPFSQLDPSVETYWYLNVREGLPLWAKVDELTGFSLAPLLVGLVGSWLAWGKADDADSKARWLVVLAALAGMTILGLLVMRIVSVAHLFALPGCAWLGLALWNRARSMATMIPRIALSLVAAIALPPISGAAAAIAITAMVGSDATDSEIAENAQERMCVDPVSLAGLRRLDPATVMSPLDIGPHLLQRTAHSVVATGHHRNNAVMAATIAVFIGPPDQAEAVARRHGATLIVTCPGSAEYRNFRDAPGVGLADMLATSPAPVWLTPVPLGEGAQLRAWRLTPRTQP